MNENLPPITQPPEFLNLVTVLQEMRTMQQTMAAQLNVAEEMVAHAAETGAVLGAMRAVVRALVATHPDPQALQHHFEAQIELLADQIGPKRVSNYSEALQPWSQLIQELSSKR